MPCSRHPQRSGPPAVLLAFCFLAWGGVAAHAALRVVTTTQDLAAIAAAVGGDRVETLALAKGYQDPHFVDAKPSFVLALARADLLIVAGLDLEIGYLPPLIDQSRNRAIAPGGPGHLDASVGCEVLQLPAGAVTRAGGDVHPYGNPHYWTDPENGRVVARSIAARLEALDPAGGDAYRGGLQAFEARLDAKLAEWVRRMAPHRGAPVVTFHNSWPNFAKRFGLDVVGHIEPKPGIPASPAHTLSIINLIRERSVKVVVVEPYFDTKTPRYIAEKTGARMVTLYPSVGGSAAIRDYFDLFDANLGALLGALETDG